MWLGSGQQQDRHKRGFNHVDQCLGRTHRPRPRCHFRQPTHYVADHIAAVCRSGYYHLRQLRQVVRALSADGAEAVVHAFISCRLDYCDSLLTGTADCLLRRLQSLQDAAACLVTGAPRRDHIASIPRQLHWLPSRQRVRYKLATLAFPVSQAPAYVTDDCQLVAESGRRTLLRSADRSVCMRHTTLQQHLRRQIIRSSLSACVERLTCYFSQHRADKGHFLQTSQNCFVYSFMRSRRIRDILILLRRLYMFVLTYLLTISYRQPVSNSESTTDIRFDTDKDYEIPQ